MADKEFHVDFMGVGSGKCGSTWIYENIIRHPEVCDKNLKELNYFSDLYTEHDFGWYEKQFANCDHCHIKGEFSVTYLAHPDAPKRIKKHFPEIKIIAIVRDPVKRAHSNYLHSIRKGDIHPSTKFADYIENEDNLAPGRYYEYFKNFYAEFPAEQIYVIVLEEFVQDAAAGLRDIFQFLGVKDTEFLPENYGKRSNEAKNYRFLLLENILVKTYRWLSRRGYTRFVKWVLDSGVATVLRRFNASRSAPPQIDDVSKAKLVEYFRSYNADFEKVLGRNIQVWSDKDL